MQLTDLAALAEHGLLLLIIWTELRQIRKGMYKVLAWIEVNQKWRPEWERFKPQEDDSDPDEILPRDI